MKKIFELKSNHLKTLPFLMLDDNVFFDFIVVILEQKGKLKSKGLEGMIIHER